MGSTSVSAHKRNSGSEDGFHNAAKTFGLKKSDRVVLPFLGTYGSR